jgi:hypothetical protein
MTYSSFREKSVFLAEMQQANEKMKTLLGRIKVALSEQGYPLRKDTYHFLTRVLEPSNRAERTLFMLLFQSAYRSELLSAGSSYLAVRFANEFIQELVKHPKLLSRNEVELMAEYEELVADLNRQITSISLPVTEEWMQQEIERICEDPILAEAVWQAISVSGLEGKIHVEDGTLPNYVVEQKSGYYFNVLKPFKFMLPKNGCWEAQNVKVMLVDGILERVSELDKILNGAMQTKIPTLLVAHGFSEEVVATIKANVDYGKFNIMPVRLTSDLESLNVLNDIAVVCGADVVSTLKGQMVVFTEFDSLPIVERIRLTSQELTIENAKTRRAVSNHLRMLLEKRQNQSEISDISDLIDRRIQGLISAAVTLRLPNMPASKRDNTKVKIDVALRSAKTLLNLGKANLQDVKGSPAPHGSLQGAFWKALKEVQREINTMPTLSAYTGIYFAGKTILSMMTTGGLVEIVT